MKKNNKITEISLIKPCEFIVFQLWNTYFCKYLQHSWLHVIALNKACVIVYCVYLYNV